MAGFESRKYYVGKWKGPQQRLEGAEMIKAGDRSFFIIKSHA